MTLQANHAYNAPMGTDNTATKRRSPMTDTTTEARDWTVVVRKPTANRFQPTIFEGTWAEAERMAQAITSLTDLEAYYLHTDTYEVHTHTGRRVAIKGEAIAIEDLLEPCRHTLDTIAGYRVRAQHPNASTSTIRYIDGGHNYADAISWQSVMVKTYGNGRISRLYSCGHWSEDISRLDDIEERPEDLEHYYGIEEAS